MAGRDTLVDQAHQQLNLAILRITSIRGTVERGQVEQARRHAEAVRLHMDEAITRIKTIEQGDTPA